MVAIPLTSGAYEAAGLIANAQRSVNLYAEVNPKETSPNMPVTQYARPGNILLAGPPGASQTPQSMARTGPDPAAGRCLYCSTRGAADPDGDLYAVVGHDVYFVDPDFNFRQIGELAVPFGAGIESGVSPVFMADNGQTILVVDGSQNGYTIDIASHAFAPLTDPNYMGANRVDFLDSYLLMNVPGKNQFYSTPSEAVTPIDPLMIGIKTAWPDNVGAVIVVQREIYVLGPKKGEVWFNAGMFPFPFQLMPGVIVEWGIQAIYSACKMDVFAYWIASAPEGGYMAVKAGAQNFAERISTHAIEREWKTYPRVDDCIGSTYQIEGHQFVRFSFPTADKCWVYDALTAQWFEDLSIDQNGTFHRSRCTFTAFAYGRNLGLDYANGSLYEISQEAYTDAGMAVPWVRAFPHIVNELRYAQHPYFMADIQAGIMPDTTEGTPLPAGLGGDPGPQVPSGPRPAGPEDASVPVIHFRMSRDGGGTFGEYRSKRNMSAGNYRPKVRWRGLGLATDAVFELSSTAQMCPALNGAYIDPIPSAV